MNTYQKGKWFRSEAMPWSAGNVLPVRLAFLDPARQMSAPEICEIVCVFTGTVGAVAGGAKGRDAAKLFGKVIVRDSEDIWNTSGAAARLVEQMELGGKQVDPSDLSSGTTNTTYEYHLRLVFEPERALRPRAFRVPLSAILGGGAIQIQWAAAVPKGLAAAQADWNVTIFMRVIDGRTKELKTRMKTWEHVINQQEFYYPNWGGLLRTAIISSTLTTTGYTSLAAFTTLYSQSLDTIPSLQTSMLVDLYRRFGHALGTNDEFTLSTPGAIPLQVPSGDQKIGECPELLNLHLNLLQAAPTSGCLITQTIVDRNPTTAAMQLGLPSADALMATTKARGRTVIGDGDNPTVQEFGLPRLARKLPARL